MAATVTVHNRQRTIPIDVPWLQKFAERALVATNGLRAKQRQLLAALHEIDVVLISDRKMSELHERFMQIAGPTDVITFQHGEIFISVQTANRHAQEEKTTLVHELQLYIAHGLLHLAGYDDTTRRSAAEMSRLQERLTSTAAKLAR
jgi:probable rRNA maturation factor